VVSQAQRDPKNLMISWNWLMNRFNRRNQESMTLSFIQRLDLDNVSYTIVADALDLFESLIEFRARIRYSPTDEMLINRGVPENDHDLYRHFASYESFYQVELLRLRIRSAPCLRKFCLDFTETCHVGTNRNLDSTPDFPTLSDCHQLEELRLMRILFVWSSSLTFLDRIPRLRCLEMCIEHSFPISQLLDQLVTYRDTLEVCRIHSDTFSTKILAGLNSCRRLREVLVSLGECLDNRLIDVAMYLWNKLELLTLVDIPLEPLCIQDRENVYRELHRLIVFLASLSHPPKLKFQSEEPYLRALLRRWREMYYPGIFMESEQDYESIFSRVYPF
jgi:hypothetical protein